MDGVSCTCAAAVFVVADTIKTDSSKGCPIELKNCSQNVLVAFNTKLFPLPPEPVKYIISLEVAPLSIKILVAFFFSISVPNFVIVGSFKNASMNEEQITLKAADCFGSKLNC